MSEQLKPVESLDVDQLRVHVYASRQDLGVAAGQAMARQLRAVLARQPRARIVLASAPSQNEFLTELAAQPGIDWERVTAFHMDEYIGLRPEAPQSFARFLKERLYDHVRPGVVHNLNGLAADAPAECRRYAELLQHGPIDIVCAGIGENGHLAFNDPPYADLQDRETVKVVTLALQSREQQVHDGCFPELAAVPKYALTLTIPALMSAQRIYGMVPGPTKAQAVLDTLHGQISAACPATVLRRHGAATLYLDLDSAGLYLARRGQRR